MTPVNKNNRYLVISSKGEIDINSFTLLGNSTKRDDKDKIGRFGSGLKYSVARLLDMDIPFKVFSGDSEIEFHTEEQKFRDDIFDVIYINGEKTNFTTQMGPDWESYDCIREIYANAADEELLKFYTTDKVEPKEGETRFYLEIIDGIEKVIRNAEKYFSFFRIDEIYSNDKNLKIYPSNGHLVIYKDGFMVHENVDQKSLFHYDYSDASINESRVLKRVSSTMNSIASELYKNPSTEVLNRLKRAMRKENFDSDLLETDMQWWTFNSMDEKWAEVFNSGTVVSSESYDFYKGHLQGVRDVFVAPKRLAKELKKVNPDIRHYGKGSNDKANDYIELEGYNDHPKVKKALDFLKEVDVNVYQDIKVAKFEMETVVGSVDSSDDTIVLSKELIEEESFWELVSTILEEFYHIESKKGDYTRGFQTYLLGKVVEYMRKYKNEKGV